MVLAGKMKAKNIIPLYYLLSNICKIHRSDEVDFSSSLPCNNKNRKKLPALLIVELAESTESSESAR